MPASRWQVGDWFRIGPDDDGNEDVGHIVAISADGTIWSQWFDPVPECPDECLDGDGGSGGADHDGRVKIDDPPRLKWCEHCQAEGYAWSSN